MGPGSPRDLTSEDQQVEPKPSAGPAQWPDEPTPVGKNVRQTNARSSARADTQNGLLASPTAPARGKAQVQVPETQARSGSPRCRPGRHPDRSRPDRTPPADSRPDDPRRRRDPRQASQAHAALRRPHRGSPSGYNTNPCGRRPRTSQPEQRHPPANSRHPRPARGGPTAPATRRDPGRPRPPCAPCVLGRRQPTRHHPTPHQPQPPPTCKNTTTDRLP
jgi:hypothetical protein